MPIIPFPLEAKHNYLREPITAFWNWHALLQIWLGKKVSNPRIWRRHCSIDRREWWCDILNF